jgi:hypothetical protein
MKLQVSRVDLALTKKSWPADIPFSPAYIYKRPVENVEHWLVVDEPLEPGKKHSTTSSYQDPYIRIPLFQYTINPDADLAFAYMLQLGLSCAAHIPSTVKKLHIVTGFPVDLLYDDAIKKSTGLRYWFGFAYLLGD